MSDKDKSYGFVMIPRGTWDNPDFADERFSEREAYLWMREQANYKDRPYRRGYKVYNLKRGQFPCTITGLADRFKWSRWKVRAFLDLLKSQHYIDHSTDTPFCVITICNYNENQHQKISHRQQTDTEFTTSPTLHRHTYNKEIKIINKKEEKPPISPKGGESDKYSSGFNEFWEVYPQKKSGPKASFKIYQRKIKLGVSHEDIIQGARRFAEHCVRGKQEKRFIVHASTWLNQERWTVSDTELRENESDTGQTKTGGKGYLNAVVNILNKSTAATEIYSGGENSVDQASGGSMRNAEEIRDEGGRFRDDGGGLVLDAGRQLPYG